MQKDTENQIQIKVKFLILKFGKLLLKHNSQNNKWSLLDGYMHPEENLYKYIPKEIIDKSGWESTNIRLFQITSSSCIEVVFIVDAVKQTLQADKNILGFKWFQLNDLPQRDTFLENDGEIVYAFSNLVHPGKTLDLEHLPPVFNFKRNPEEVLPQLLRLVA